MKKQFILTGIFIAATFAIKAQNHPEKYAAKVTAAQLKEQLTIIAGAEMEGRETATPGQKKAAAYIENYFKKLGLLPGAGNGSYQQYFDVYKDSITKLALKVYGMDISAGTHFVVNPTAIQSGNISSTQIVYASYGIKDSTRNDLQGLNVKGKWVMILDATPNDIDKNVSAPRFGAGSVSAKIQELAKLGASGVLVVGKNFPARNFSLVSNQYMKTNSPALQAISISPQLAGHILNKPVNTITDLKNIPTKEYTTKIDLAVQKEKIVLQSSNVLGLIEGTDKKDEYLFITAHYDHIGRRGDIINYGADDDGSGTVSVMELAKAFMAAKAKKQGPRRSIVFMTVSGEEKGLWGSEYYSEHPIYPLDKTTADLNIDMVGRIDPTYKGDSLNYCYLIGEDKLSSDLQKITDEVNNKYIKMEVDRRFNDPKDPNRFYYRSDHYNFAKVGVPIIFYFNGTHADYHRPTDTVEKINFPLMEKRARLIFHTAWIMANRDEMLKRDLPLNMPAR